MQILLLKIQLKRRQFMTKQKKKKTKVKKEEPPYPNKQIIKGALRRVMSRSPVIRTIKEKAVHPTEKGKRGGKQYVCASCKATFAGNEVQVDHIKPVLRIQESVHDLDYNMLVKRIFCNPRNLQVLCKECHKTKTKEENRKRKEFFKPKSF
jgi:5-methylcytosine-specific restriction endonuclease McrA